MFSFLQSFNVTFLTQLHTRTADEAVRVGPAPATESYLVMDAVLSAVDSTGAQAVSGSCYVHVHVHLHTCMCIYISKMHKALHAQVHCMLQCTYVHVQYRSRGTYTRVKKNSRVISARHASGERSSLEYECSRARVILEYEGSRARVAKRLRSCKLSTLRSRARHGRESTASYSRLYS